MEKKQHKKRRWLWWVLIVFLAFCAFGATAQDNEEEPAHEEKQLAENENAAESEITEAEKDFVGVEDELTDAERLGVSETVLSEIESVMRVAGWDFDRKDFERIYRLKDEEMTMNPAQFVEYEVTIKGGKTHSLTLSRVLVDE